MDYIVQINFQTGYKSETQLHATQKRSALNEGTDGLKVNGWRKNKPLEYQAQEGWCGYDIKYSKV